VYPRPKELRIVGAHEICELWEDDLALKVHAILDEKGVDWSSTDVLHIVGFAICPQIQVAKERQS